MIDTSGVTALQQFLKRCQRHDTAVILSGLQPQPRGILAQMGVQADGKQLRFARDFAEAVALASS
jgi:SulP family sulfate permease